MHVEVIRKTFRDRLFMTVAAGTGVGVLVVGSLLIFEVMAIDSESIVDGLPEALRSLIGVAGGDVNYVLSEVYGIMVPIVVLILGISSGVAAIAGEERQGTAAILFAQPIGRRSVVRSKALVLLVHVCMVAALAMVFTLIGGVFIDIGTSGANVAATCLLGAALGVAFGMIALALGAATGSTTIAMGASAALAVAAYLVKSLFPLISGWESAARISPWYYYDGSGPLANGLAVSHLAVLVLLSVAGAGAAVLAVDGRDLGGGGAGRRLQLPVRLDRLFGPRVSGPFTFALWNRASVMLISSCSLAAVAIGIGAMYPGLRETLDDIFKDLPDSMAGFIGSTDLASGTGWINAELLSILAPFSVIGVTTTLAANSLSGEISRRRLGLVLAHPVSRSSIVAANALSIAAVSVIVSACTGLGLVAGSAIGGLGLDDGHVFAAVTQLAALGILFGMLSLAISARWSTRLAIGLTVSTAFVAYLMYAILGLSDRFRPWRVATPWHYYAGNDPLANGLSLGYTGALVGVALLAAAAAVALFEGREVS